MMKQLVAGSLVGLLFCAPVLPSVAGHRLTPAPASPRAAIQEPPRDRLEDVRYQSGKIMLAAMLMVPESGKRAPGAVIIQGSGASDRTNQWARAIAQVLVNKGAAVLLTDKRGSGKSEGNWQTADFNDLAADAIAGVQYLRSRNEIDPERVGLVGLSQGGWIAPLAAARSEQVAFVIDISGASVSFAEQSFTEMANTARKAGLTEKQVREVLELNRAVAQYLTTGDWQSYAEHREKALKSEWGKIAAGFPGTPDLPIWTFLRGVATYDPLPYWLQLTEPVLVISCLSGCYSKQPDVVVYSSFDIPCARYQAVGSRRATGSKPEQSLECGHW